ncbi:MAG: hypothetical protein Q8R13_05970 [bacterium]|nr:hypothetical protein [bacterium]
MDGAVAGTKAKGKTKKAKVQGKRLKLEPAFAFGSNHARGKNIGNLNEFVKERTELYGIATFSIAQQHEPELALIG